MPFIKRNDDGSIHSIAQQQDDVYREYLPATDPHIAIFLQEKEGQKPSQEALQASDRDIPRITEDLIYLLISKNIILFTELPETVQNKLLRREKLRSSARRSTIENFLDEDEMI